MKFNKTILTLALLIILAISCKKPVTKVGIESGVAKKELLVLVKSQTASFNIQGMTCAVGCAKTIQEKIGSMEGVQKANVDFDKKTAIVVFDANKQSLLEIQKEVEATGDGNTYKVLNLK